MKILTINTRYIGGGGAAYIANTLHQELNKRDGYLSTFLYGRGENGDQHSKRIIYNKMDTLSALSYRLFSKEINYNKDIETQIRECDIVHLHNIHGYYINYVKLFKLLKKYNKKVIWTLHDMWPITGRCAYTFGCEKWKDNCGKCENKSSYPASMLDRSEQELQLKKAVIESINEKNMIIVTPSKWLGNICRESYLNKFKIIDIPNGIEEETVSLSKNEIRKKYKLEENDKVILFVAADTTDERKGIKYILDVIPRCKDFKFVSIGKEIKEDNYGNLIQLGYISNRATINEIYSMADVFVIPSLDENFPTTVLESFANGTPAIGFSVGGIPEQINCGTGIIVNDISSESLLDGINTIMENSNLRKNLSSQCKCIFKEKYTKRKFVENYINIYKQVLNSD